MPVSQARIEALFGIDEHEKLDHKLLVDLDQRRDVVELVKDLAAMLAKGGDIVIGTDDDGDLQDQMTEVLARKFDEANLRNKIERYLDKPLPFRVGRAVFDGRWAVVVHVQPSPDGIAVFRAEGTYEVEKNGAKRPRTVFSRGDVFVRHGSKSERWVQADVRDFVDRTRTRERERTLREHQESTESAVEAQTEALQELAEARKPELPPDFNIAANPDLVPEPNDVRGVFNLWMIWRLARFTEELDAEETRMLESEYEAVLDSGRVPQNTTWPNGETASIGDSWYYPNGQIANIGDSWYYPDGQTANIGDSWYYPNGQTLNIGETWYQPNGRSVGDDDGIRRCIRVKCSSAEWRRYEDGFFDLYGHAYMLAMVELAWTLIGPPEKEDD